MAAKKQGLAGKGIVARTKARLMKKLGPFPLWVYVAVVLLVGVYYLRHRSASSATTAAASTVPVDSGYAASTGYDTSGAGGGCYSEIVFNLVDQCADCLCEHVSLYGVIAGAVVQAESCFTDETELSSF